MTFKFRLFLFSGLDTDDLEVLVNVGWCSYREQEGAGEGGKYHTEDHTSFPFAQLKAFPRMEICLNNPRKC